MHSTDDVCLLEEKLKDSEDNEKLLKLKLLSKPANEECEDSNNTHTKSRNVNEPILVSQLHDNLNALDLQMIKMRLSALEEEFDNMKARNGDRIIKHTCYTPHSEVSTARLISHSNLHPPKTQREPYSYSNTRTAYCDCVTTVNRQCEEMKLEELIQQQYLPTQPNFSTSGLPNIDKSTGFNEWTQFQIQQDMYPGQSAATCNNTPSSIPRTTISNQCPTSQTARTPPKLPTHEDMNLLIQSLLDNCRRKSNNSNPIPMLHNGANDTCMQITSNASKLQQ